MTGNDLAKMFELSYGAINRNLEDVSHGESLVVPDTGGNCLNWVLGHVVVTRNTVLKLAGREPAFTSDKAELYRRGSSPSESSQYLDLATLRGMLDDSQQELIPALSMMSEQTLAREVPEPFNRPPLTGSVCDAFIRLHYHEGYHNGQIGILRRIAGKQGAIK